LWERYPMQSHSLTQENIYKIEISLDFYNTIPQEYREQAMMALVDPSTSQLSLAILFLVVLLCPPLPLRRWLQAIFFYSPVKASITDEEVSIGILARPKPQLPHTWWTDENQHRLERRAIFSTVRSNDNK